MHVKKGDKVAIIAGKDAGSAPSTVKAVLPGANRVIVDGRNLVTKHIKANPAAGRESDRVETEAAIHASNVLMWSEKLGRGVRTQVRFVGADGKLFKDSNEAKASFATPVERVKKVRFCAKTEEIFE